MYKNSTFMLYAQKQMQNVHMKPQLEISLMPNKDYKFLRTTQYFPKFSTSHLAIQQFFLI